MGFVGLILAVVAILWADIHFLLAVFRVRLLRDIIPLIGMGITTFAMVWCFIKMWQYRHGWSPLNNLLANLRTLLRRRDARSDALVDRLTLPPAEFERKLADGA
jgi:hypothetical protein